MITNIMSVDLEDHFCDLPFSRWKDYESKVAITTNMILDLFEKTSTTATFFTLGYVAENNPELIKDIKSRGHEIASHGYHHIDIRKMTRESFEEDLVKSLETLKRICGEQILGFRAPWFSITRKNLWVFDILKKYLRYDSSLVPVRFHYGFPTASRHFYKISDKNPLKSDPKGNFIEIPISTLKIPILGNIPTGGGIYLRILPIKFLKKGILNLNKCGFPTVCYIHPQDLDPDRPHLKGLAWHNFIGLKNSRKKFESILHSFSFSSVKNVLQL